MRSILFASLGACGLAFAGSPVFAQSSVPKLPASGKARFEVAYFRAEPSRNVQLDDQTDFGSFQQYGVTRNLDGQPWFDRMSEYCTGQYYDTAGKPPPAPTNGSCVYVDLDGDKVAINWVDQGNSGTKQVVGGTGKYGGITGKGTYSFVADLKPPTETSRIFLVTVDLDFQMKGPTQ